MVVVWKGVQHLPCSTKPSLGSSTAHQSSSSIMRHRRRAAAARLSVVALLLCQAAVGCLAAHGPGSVGLKGIPVCAAGLDACGMHGCYTPLLSKCDPNRGCISVKLLTQLSAFVRFGSSAAEHAGACPIGFANTCGDEYCGMGEVCAAGVCQSSSPAIFTAHKVGNSVASAKAACLAARYGSTACAQDSTDMVPVECNGIGVPSVKGIFCFQSQLFNCAVQPGGSATFTCRGIAGVAQAVGEVWNSTINTAAQVAADVADAIAKQEQEQVVAAASANKARVAMTGGVPLVLADSGPGGSSGSSGGDGTPGGGSGGAGSRGEVWRVGANAALGSLSHKVRDRLAPEGGPILQPIFANLAHMVNNASKSLLNITAEGVAESAKSRYQSTFDLGPPPIRDAAGEVPRATWLLLVRDEGAAAVAAAMLCVSG